MATDYSSYDEPREDQPHYCDDRDPDRGRDEAPPTVTWRDVGIDAWNDRHVDADGEKFPHIATCRRCGGPAIITNGILTTTIACEVCKLTATI